MNKKQWFNKSNGFTLLEIIIVVVLLGLIVVPMIQLITSIMFSVSKENIRADIDRKGRTVLEQILFDVREARTTDYIEIYDYPPGVMKTAKGQTGTTLKITDKQWQPNTRNPEDMWYTLYTDATSGKKYLLKFQNSVGPNGIVPATDWRKYIFMDRVKTFNIEIMDKALVSNKLYDEYAINLELEYGKSAKDRILVQLNKQFKMYLDK